MFKFRLRFSTPRGQIINIDKRLYKIDLSTGSDYIVRPFRADKLNEASTFEITSSLFSTKEESIKYAKRLQSAILIAGARLFLGFNTGDEIFFLKDGYYEPEVINGVYHFKTPEIVEDGIEIHENKIQRKGGITNVTITDLGNIDRLFNTIRKAYLADRQLNDKQKLALSFCNLARFEAFVEPAFVSLVTAIEVLANRIDRSSEEVGLVSRLHSEVRKSDLSPESKRSILSSLKDLKKISIGESCGNFVKRRLGSDVAKKFKKLYIIRSQLVHSGKVKRGIDLKESYSELQRIVAFALIFDIFGKDIFDDLI